MHTAGTSRSPHRTSSSTSCSLPGERLWAPRTPVSAVPFAATLFLTGTATAAAPAIHCEGDGKADPGDDYAGDRIDEGDGDGALAENTQAVSRENTGEEHHETADTP